MTDSTPTDLLALLYAGEVSEEGAEQLIEQAVKRGDDVQAAFGFAVREATAYLHGANVVTLARLRYEGWPLHCWLCRRPLNYAQGFRYEDSHGHQHHIVHMPHCPRLSDPNDRYGARGVELLQRLETLLESVTCQDLPRIAQASDALFEQTGRPHVGNSEGWEESGALQQLHDERRHNRRASELYHETIRRVTEALLRAGCTDDMTLDAAVSGIASAVVALLPEVRLSPHERKALLSVLGAWTGHEWLLLQN